MPLFEDKPLTIIADTLLLIIRVPLPLSSLGYNPDHNTRVNGAKDLDLKIGLALNLTKCEVLLSQDLVSLLITRHLLHDVLDEPEMLHVLIVDSVEVYVELLSQSALVLLETIYPLVQSQYLLL